MFFRDIIYTKFFISSQTQLIMEKERLKRYKEKIELAEKRISNIEEALQTFWKETSKLAAIPIDGFILVSNQNGQKYAKQEVDSEIQSILLSYRDIKTDLTIIDVFRIWLFSKTLSSNSVSVKDIADFPNAVIEDKILSTLFNDYTFSQEKNSIEIINAADISGLGNRVARALTNMGGNVISVSTSDKTSQTSQILYFGDKTYTVEKLGKVLGLATFQTEKQGISDVTIILGKDSANYLPF